MQRSTRSVAVNPDFFALEPYPASAGFSDVVLSTVRHDDLPLDLVHILLECLPRRSEMPLGGAIPFMVFLVMIVLRQSAISDRPHTGNYDGVDTVVDVVYPFFFCLYVLYAPYLAKVGRGQPFDDKDSVEERFQIQTSIL